MITFVTCWYRMNSKLSQDVYIKYIHNFLDNVSNANIVIYTNTDSYEDVQFAESKSNMKIILCDFYEFETNKLIPFLQKNKNNPSYTNKSLDIELQMVYLEKVAFLKKTIDHNPFNSTWFGWCDIGYFRCRNVDIQMNQIKQWPRKNIENNLEKDKIYYGNVNGNVRHVFNLFTICVNQNAAGLPKMQLPHDMVAISGGFCLLHRDKMTWYYDKFYDLLNKYVHNGYYVKDDQMIIFNCIALNQVHFKICTEFDKMYDNWFMFQRILS